MLCPGEAEPEMGLGLAPPKPGLVHVEEGGFSDK